MILQANLSGQYDVEHICMSYNRKLHIFWSFSVAIHSRDVYDAYCGSEIQIKIHQNMVIVIFYEAIKSDKCVI